MGSTDLCEAELVAEPGLLLQLLLGLVPAERMQVNRVLVHVALVALLLTQPEIIAYTTHI
jgi:hypothetical protein